MPYRILAPSLSAAPTRRAHLDAWHRSGLSARAYAEQHGLHPSTLHRWRRRDSDDAVHEIPRLVPVTIAPSADCEIILPDGRRLRFPETLSAATLRAILAAMEAT